MTIEPISNLEPGLSVREKLNALISLSETLETDVAQSLTNDANLLGSILEIEERISAFSPMEYGAVGDGVTDDGVALNATFAALKAYVESFPGQAGTASIDLKGRAYLTTISVNATNINAGGWGLRDGLIIGTCVGKAVLDMTGSRWGTLESVTVYGDPLSAPAIGIQVGRDGVQEVGGFCDGHSWRMVQTRGAFTTTAVYVYGQEGSHYDHCKFWNQDPDGHCGVHTGFNWIPYTSDYSVVATGSVSYIQNKYTNCEWRHIPVGRRFAITGASTTNPFVVTVASHNFEVGDDICIGDMEGMIEPFGLVATVTAKTATTLTFGAVDASTWTPRVSGGAVTLADSVSALVVGDGSLHTFERCYTVANGQANVEMVFSGVRPNRHYFMDMHCEGECHGPCVKFTGGTADRALVNCDFRTHNARPSASYFGQTVDAFDTVFQETEVIIPTKRFTYNTHTLFDDPTRYSMIDAKVTVWEAAAVTVGSMASFSGTLSVSGSTRNHMNRIDIQHTGDLSDLRFMDVTGATVEGFIRHATAAQAITINPTGVGGQSYTFGSTVFNSAVSRSLGGAVSPWSTVWGTQYRVGNLANSAPIITTNAGTPEGVVTAVPGSICLNTSGGAGTSLYVKQTGTGNTGWVGK